MTAEPASAQRPPRDDPAGPGQQEDGPDPEATVDLEAAVDPRAPRIGAHLAVGLTAAAALGIVTIAVQARGGSLATWDQAVHDWVLARRGPADIAVATAVTAGGATALTIPAAALVGALALPARPSWRSRITAGALLAAVGGAGVYAGLLLNGATGRERPDAADWAGAAGGPSFPSGHTTAATVFALGCAWAVSAHLTSAPARRLVGASAVLWAGAVGWTRVWLGVHWPSDVVAGWLFGLAWCAVAAAVVAALRRRAGSTARARRPEASRGHEAATSRSLRRRLDGGPAADRQRSLPVLLRQVLTQSSRAASRSRSRPASRS